MPPRLYEERSTERAQTAPAAKLSRFSSTSTAPAPANARVATVLSRANTRKPAISAFTILTPTIVAQGQDGDDTCALKGSERGMRNPGVACHDGVGLGDF